MKLTLDEIKTINFDVLMDGLFDLFSDVPYPEGDQYLRAIIDRVNADGLVGQEQMFRLFVEDPLVMRGINRPDRFPESRALWLSKLADFRAKEAQ